MWKTKNQCMVNKGHALRSCMIILMMNSLTAVYLNFIEVLFASIIEWRNTCRANKERNFFLHLQQVDNQYNNSQEF